MPFGETIPVHTYNLTISGDKFNWPAFTRAASTWPSFRSLKAWYNAIKEDEHAASMVQLGPKKSEVIYSILKILG